MQHASCISHHTVSCVSHETPPLGGQIQVGSDVPSTGLSLGDSRDARAKPWAKHIGQPHGPSCKLRASEGPGHRASELDAMQVASRQAAVASEPTHRGHALGVRRP